MDDDQPLTPPGWPDENGVNLFRYPESPAEGADRLRQAVQKVNDALVPIRQELGGVFITFIVTQPMSETTAISGLMHDFPDPGKLATCLMQVLERQFGVKFVANEPPKKNRIIHPFKS